MSPAQSERARRLLCRLQDQVRDRLRTARGGRMCRVAAVTAADTIYAVDKVGERVVLDWMARNWPRAWPVELVMEGLDDGTTFPRGTPVAATKFKLILDPIDGTRGLMYDKRSAWSLAGLAPQRGAQTSVADISVAAMTELPTSKAGWTDQFSTVRGRGIHAERIELRTGRRRRWAPRPSRASDLTHGFASFAKFLPEGKAWLAAVEEKLWAALTPAGAAGSRQIFDDQYLSTGGQLAELIAGRDRFVADIRPLAFAAMGTNSTFACHPYDICTALIAREAGCIVESPAGRPLRAPLDTTTPVAWTGYANARLARSIRPALRRLLRSPTER